MRFSQDFIEKVRDANNLVDEISQFTQLKVASTSQHMGLCPYPDHNEKTGSFSVSESQQVYHCFGCKKSGNIFTFLQDIKNYNFPEAVEYLANKAGIAMPKENNFDSSQNEKSKELKKSLLRMNEVANNFFTENLKKAPQEVKDYVKKRGLEGEILEKFEIGFGPDEWEGLVNEFQRSNLSNELGQQLGLLKARTKGKGGFYDIFRSRLMFPIHSHTGDIIGFGGRIIGDGQPKYLNSPESVVFHKGKTFYGLFETAKYIRTEDYAIVVEGYMDLLALYRVGIKNVVATLGTALTPDHARLLKRYTKNVVVMFDGDQAGQTAAERSLPILLQQGLFPRGCVLPDNLDPDDFLIKFGKDELLKTLKQSPELFYVVTSKFFDGYRGEATQKVALVDQIAPHLRTISDTRLKSLYISDMAQRLAVTPQWLVNAIKSQKPEFHNKPQESAPEEPKKAENSNNFKDIEKIIIQRPDKTELYLLNLSLKNRDTFERILDSGVLEQFSHEKLRQVFFWAKQIYVQNPSEFDKLTTLLVERVQPTKAVTMHLEPEFQSLTKEAEVKLVEDYIRKVQDEFLKRRADQLKAVMIAKDPVEQQQVLKELMEIQQQRRNLFKDKSKEMEN